MAGALSLRWLAPTACSHLYLFVVLLCCMFSRLFVIALFVEGVVSGGGMPDADIEPLMRALITNTTLHTLNLSSELIDLSTM